MDVVQILIFLGMICWGLFQARQQTRKKPIRGKVQGKTIPANPYPMEEKGFDEARIISSSEVRKKEEKRYVKQEKQARREVQVHSQMHQTEEPRSEISFHTPSDARRAFIYSEIFRRKYD